ncbi:hypothetical protein RchiOBHm_Chr3g0495801 [Rosa chinensis]|uniref:DNA-directed DNA polymerase n=1 Tax=Rosa chinensis TaxID=74649 RepID=A0A2P6RHB6_ROSCH|nr:hypothetical protein RchiOBHm_Chr3g0495801 [Rosa chinensis]
MEPLSSDSEELPIILGRAFMATAGTKIDVQKGILTMTVFDTTIGFRIFDVMKSSVYLKDCFRVETMDIIDDLVEESSLRFNDDDIIEDVNHMEIIMPFQKEYKPKIVPLPPITTRVVPSLESPPTLELKPLPPTLKYVFLGDKDTLPVIISSKLSELEEGKLLGVLKEHKNALGWTIADIKGICPSKCMHRIHLEENSKPVRDAQRRLNPPMMEVVKAEVLKLLDVGVIYPISDSKWVSTVQVFWRSLTSIVNF